MSETRRRSAYRRRFRAAPCWFMNIFCANIAIWFSVSLERSLVISAAMSVSSLASSEAVSEAVCVV